MSDEITIEKPKDESAVPKVNGGARPGAGRKKGGENEATKEKRIVKQAMIDRILKSTSELLNSQMTLAQGIQYLYVIKTVSDGKNGTKKLRPEVITSQSIIEDYLAGELDNKDMEYYYLTTEKPDNKALDSLFDRTFGKAQQNIDVKSDGEKLEGIIMYPIKDGKSKAEDSLATPT